MSIIENRGYFARHAVMWLGSLSAVEVLAIGHDWPYATLLFTGLIGVTVGIFWATERWGE